MIDITGKSYKDIEKFVLDSIENGNFREKSKIPSEIELAEKFNVSRMTANKALSRLAEKNIISRKRGIGSFVNPIRIERQIPLMQSFTETHSQPNIKVTSSFFNYKVENVSSFPFLKNTLFLDDEDLIHFFIRVRYLNKKAIAVSYNYVVANIVRNLDIYCLNNSFYDYLERTLGLELGYNDTVIEVVYPNDELRAYLNIQKDQNQSLVLSTHTSYLTNDKPFEYTKTYYLAEYYSFKYKCYRNI